MPVPIILTMPMSKGRNNHQRPESALASQGSCNLASLDHGLISFEMLSQRLFGHSAARPG
jgi:hypothetical protein